MRIGIIGAGHIGATAARLFVRAGHEVAVSNSRGPESLRELVAELGERARAASVEEAARFGEVVLLAVPWRTPEALPPPEAVRGKVVKAFLVLRPGVKPGAELLAQVQEFARSQMAPYKCPRLIEIVESLPKTASGKVKRAELRGR